MTRRSKPGSARKSRWKIIERDGWKCVWCKSKSCLTIDHIIHWSKGGTNERSNLQTLCRACNNRRGDADIMIDDLPPVYFEHVLGVMKEIGGVYRIGCSCGYATPDTNDSERCQVAATIHRQAFLPHIIPGVTNAPRKHKPKIKHSSGENARNFVLTIDQVREMLDFTLDEMPP